MTDGRISLADNFQFGLFRNSMNYLNKRKRDLSPYDRDFYRKLRDGWDLARREMTITVAQLNHLRQVHFELESGKYRND